MVLLRYILLYLLPVGPLWFFDLARIIFSLLLTSSSSVHHSTVGALACS